MEELLHLRELINEADDQIVRLLNNRFALSRRVQDLKRNAGLPRVDEQRESEILSRVFASADPAEKDTVISVYERILGGSRGLIETVARGVAVREGRVLVCRSKGGKSSYLPGGHIEFGETGREALVRELKEELGVASTAGDFLGVLENTFDQAGKRHAEINLIYALQVEGDFPATSVEPWLEFEWVKLEDLPRANLLPQEIARYVTGSGESTRP